VRRSLIGTHVRGVAHRGGVPILDTAAAVHVLGGRVALVEAHGAPAQLPGSPVARPVSRAAAVRAALATLGVTESLRPPVAERLMVARGDRLVDTWRISVLGAAPAVAATVEVAAADGQVLATFDPRRTAPTAMVFDPNPVVRLKDTSLREPGVDQAGVDTDLDSPRLTAARTPMPLTGVDETRMLAGRLTGPWVDVIGPGPMPVLDGKVDYTRGDPRFEATMAYAHIDRLQRYLQSLGFTGDGGANAEQQTVLAVPVPSYDNSFYMPAHDLIAFGSGGVDDGEDAEVIVHEYGHAIHDDQVPGWGRRPQGGAMGEGFGDFLAASYFARDTSGGFGDACVADWDAVSYSSANPPCLRRVDSTKVYPKDLRNQVHADGELWSSMLWRLRARLGETEQERTDNVLRLLITSHELLTTQAEFGHAVAALRATADSMDPTGELGWVRTIEEVAAQTNMPLNP
jgi:hypothetical protein